MLNNQALWRRKTFPDIGPFWNKASLARVRERDRRVRAETSTSHTFLATVGVILATVVDKITHLASCGVTVITALTATACQNCGKSTHITPYAPIKYKIFHFFLDKHSENDYIKPQSE